MSDATILEIIYWVSMAIGVGMIFMSWSCNRRNGRRK